MRKLIWICVLTLQGFAFDIEDIEIMRQDGVLIAYQGEREAHTIANGTTPSQLLEVKYLKLDGQYLNAIPSWLPQMTNIIKLELQNTNIDLIDLTALSPLINLNSLDLSNNPKLFNKGGSLNELLQYFHLYELSLDNTGGSSSDYQNIGSHKSLIKLDLSNNSLSSIEGLGLQNLNNLKELKIIQSGISGTLDTAYLPKESLEYLDLSSNDIKRFLYSSDFPTLNYLNISNNQSYLEFDEAWNDAYILKKLSDGAFNKGVALPTSIMKRLGIESKWLTPTSTTCTANGGKIESNGICEAPWEEAKAICSASGGSLPSIEELKDVVTGCGGTNATLGDSDWESITDKNKANTSYQSCYKSQGFTSYGYWSATAYADGTSTAWGVNFYFGGDSWGNKSHSFYVRCVR